MLTQEDKKFILQTINGSLKGAFQDFYENIFEPHVERSERQHGEIVREINSLKKEMSGVKYEVGEIKEFIKDHERRIQKLETVTGV